MDFLLLSKNFCCFVSRSLVIANFYERSGSYCLPPQKEREREREKGFKGLFVKERERERFGGKTIGKRFVSRALGRLV